MGFIKEFQEFAVKGNVMDMAVGVIIGGAFGKIVASLVNDVIMPPLGNGFTDLKLVLKPATAAVTDASGNVVTPEVAEVALNYGNFIQNTVDFIIIAFVIFLLIKGMNSLRKKEEPAPTAPAEDPADIALLKEIRDELKKRN